jgi:hypothetical protein
MSYAPLDGSLVVDTPFVRPTFSPGHWGSRLERDARYLSVLVCH